MSDSNNKIQIIIDNGLKRAPLKDTIHKKAGAVLNALRIYESELSILIVDDKRIAELNQQYLNRKGPTNVIAFPMREGEYTEISRYLLGDVVISIDTAIMEASIAGIKEEERFDRLLIHGILHLLGYDHESDLEKASIMEAKEEELMKVV